MKTKLIITALAFSLVSAAPPGTPPVEYITINGHTYGLDRSPECMKNPSCLKGAAVVAREAVVAATAQMDAASKEVKATENKIGDHVDAVSKYGEDARRVAISWANFVADKIVPHNEDAGKQNAANIAAVAAIDEFNGRPAEQQSAGEASRLNADLKATLDWGKIVDNRVIALTEEGAPMLDEKFRLIKERQDLMEANTRLRNALMIAQFKEGEAYRQLLKCAEYAREINELMKKYTSQGINYIELNDADATLKNKSNSMFGEGNSHTGSVLVRPGYSAVPNTESYQSRAKKLIEALPPGQRTAVAEVKKPKTIPPKPATDKSTSTGVMDRFMRWIGKQ